MRDEPTVSVAGLEFLLGLIEQEPPLVTATILEEELAEEARPLIGSGLLVPGPSLNAVAVGNDPTLRPILEFGHATGTATCFHPECGFVALDAARLGTWNADAARLVAFLCRLLGLPTSFKGSSIIGNLLWDLGMPRLGRRTGVPVLFARRLTWQEERRKIRRELELRRGGKPSLLLTAARHVPEDLDLPAIARIVPLTDVLDHRSRPTKLDFDRLGAFADPRHGARGQSSAPVECGETGTWIRIHGREYLFRGKQAQIVRLLYEAWARDDAWVGEQWVLEQVESRSTKIREAFKDKHIWKTVIETKDGRCRLRVADVP